MIPILFASSETTFTSNGIGRLADARMCEVTEERNGSYELVLEYPVTGPLMSSIVPGAYIYATHDDHKTPQAFQIYQVSAPLEGFVKVNAWHISYALNSILVKPFTAGSCTSALAAIPTNSVNTNNFTFWTDKSVTATYTLTEPKSARAILGGSENSILDVYGKGEYEFDMLTVKLYVNRGANRDVTIRYGKNLKSLDQTLDASNVFNAVLPYWTNGETTVYATSLVVKTGQTANRAIVLDMSSDFTEEPTLAQLTAAAQTYVDSTDNYQVKENIKIDFVQLWQTEEYKNVANLQRVYLCDTVKIYYEKLGINATAKVIKVVYDTLLERYISMELGEPRVSLAQQIQADVSESILAEVPSRSVMQGAIDHATQLITGGSGGYIKYHYAGDGTPTEMLIMDTADESTATNIIRLNQNGIGFSNDGGSTYTSAWTIDGNFVADFITTGNLDADLLTVGRIQDASGVNYWDLDTGDFQTQRGTIADFTISTDELLNGTVGVHSYGTSIKAGTLAMSNWKPYHVGGGVYENYTTKMVENHTGLQFTFFKDADSTYRNMGGIDTDVQVINTDVYPYLLFGRSTAGMKVFTNDYVGSKLVFNGTANFANNVTLSSSALLRADGGIVGGAANAPSSISMYGDLTLNGTNTTNGDITADGNVTVAGDISGKTHYAYNTSSNGAAYYMNLTDRANATAAVLLTVEDWQYYGGRMFFRQFSGNSSGLLSNFEQYRLPAPDSGRTTNVTYDILTTKNIDDAGLHKGGAQTHAFSFTAYYRGFLFCCDSVTTRIGVYAVYATANAVYTQAIHAISGATLTTSGLSLTIDAGSGNSISIMLMDMLGKATRQ